MIVTTSDQEAIFHTHANSVPPPPNQHPTCNYLSPLLNLLTLLLLPTTLATPLPTQPILSTSTIPSRQYSTVLARRLLALSGTGVLSTIFPSNLTSNPRVPTALINTPIGLPEYIADCDDPSSGNPTLLALSVSTSTRNAVAGSNVSLAISWWDAYEEYAGAKPWSAADLPRASLTGYLEEIPLREAEQSGVVECFVGVHKDSRLWLPGSKSTPHEGVWMRMVGAGGLLDRWVRG